ncbi:MAG: sugar phosphate isomerase/epimerase [Planctomycetes bacterium]|nr:sugar phosphate isomerase/epimerase [Planctomycetota bacterium]
MVGEGATLLDKFQLLRDLGFDGVELDSPNDLKQDDVLAASQKTDLVINGLVHSKHWGAPFNSDDPKQRAESVAALEHALREAKVYGAQSVLVVPAVVDGNLSYDSAWKRSITELSKCVPLARELSVEIAIENVWNNFLLSPIEAAQYVDAFQDPIVRFHFDIGNVVAYGWPEQWVRILGPRIAKLHVKDYSRKKRDEQGRWAGFDVELGEGDANYPAVMRALDESGYSTDPRRRWATAEVGGGDRKRLAQLAEQMNRLLNS